MSAFLFLSPVAAHTVRFKKRPDLPSEIHRGGLGALQANTAEKEQGEGSYFHTAESFRRPRAFAEKPSPFAETLVLRF